MLSFRFLQLLYLIWSHTQSVSGEKLERLPLKINKRSREWMFLHSNNPFTQLGLRLESCSSGDNCSIPQNRFTAGRSVCSAIKSRRWGFRSHYRVSPRALWQENHNTNQCREAVVLVFPDVDWPSYHVWRHSRTDTWFSDFPFWDPQERFWVKASIVCCFFEQWGVTSHG